MDELKKDYGQSSEDLRCEWNVTGMPETVDLSMSGDYLCSYISDRELTASDVQGYLNTDYSNYNFPGNRDIIQMIINELYAKDGYEFTDADLGAYFSKKTWYTANTNKVHDMEVVTNSMNEVEKKNLELLKTYR